MGSVSGSGRSLGGGLGNPLQYSCLENPKDKRAEGLQPMGRKQSDTQTVGHVRAFHILPVITNILSPLLSTSPSMVVHLLQLTNLHHTSSSPKLHSLPFSSFFVVHFVHLDKCINIMAWIHHHRILQSISKALKILCALHIHLSPLNPSHPPIVLLYSECYFFQNVIYLELHCV